MPNKLSRAGALLALLAACATPPNAISTLEPGADVGSYRTFAFVQDPQQTGVIADGQVQHRLQQMITTQLAAKGYVPAFQGQVAELGVNIVGKVVPRQRVYLVGNPTPYDFHRGRIEPGGYETVDYREGTVHVDILDLRQSKLLWEAQILEQLTAGYSEENWKKVERALGEAFKSLPARR